MTYCGNHSVIYTNTNHVVYLKLILYEVYPNNNNKKNQQPNPVQYILEEVYLPNGFKSDTLKMQPHMKFLLVIY